MNFLLKISYNQKFNRMLYIISLVFLIYIVYETPAMGYEISLYENINYVFLYLSFLYIYSYYRIIFHFKYIKKDVLSISYPFLLNTYLLMIPFIKGYYIYGKGDTLTHLGNILNIIINKNLNPRNIYPILHIYGTILIYILSVDLNHISYLIVQIFYFMYILFCINLVIKLVKKTDIFLYNLIPLYFSYAFTQIGPNFRSIFIFPLILFFVTRYTINKNQKDLICYFLLSVLVLLFHPASFLIIIVTLIVFYFIRASYFHFNQTGEQDRGNILLLCFISLVIFILWTIYIKYNIFNDIYLRIYDNILSFENSALYENYLIPLNKTNLTLYYKFYLLLNRYGIFLILYLFTGAIMLYNLFLIFIKKIHQQSIYIYTILTIFTFVISILYLINDFIVTDMARITQMSIILCPILIIIFYKYGINNKINYNKLKIFMFIFILLTSILNVYTIYSSPRTKIKNFQFSRFELYGIRWVINNRNDEILINGFTKVKQNARYLDYLYGNYIWRGMKPKIYLIPEVYYANKISTEQNVYAITSKELSVFHHYLPRQLGEINKLEYVRLLSNLYFEENKLYDNKEFILWKTNYIR